MIRERLGTARVELAQKPRTQIDIDAAAAWGARAVVASENFHATGDMAWWARAVEYRHEALEHAAGGGPGVLEQIIAELDELISVR